MGRGSENYGGFFNNSQFTQQQQNQFGQQPQLGYNFGGQPQQQFQQQLQNQQPQQYQFQPQLQPLGGPPPGNQGGPQFGQQQFGQQPQQFVTNFGQQQPQRQFVTNFGQQFSPSQPQRQFGTNFGGQQQQTPINQAFGAQPQQQSSSTNTVNFGGGFNNSGNNNQIIDVPDDIKGLMENENEAIIWNESLGKLPDTFFECLKGEDMKQGPIDTSALAKNILTQIGTTTNLEAEEKLVTINSTRGGYYGTEYSCEASPAGTLCELLTKYCTYALTGEEPLPFEYIQNVFADTLIYSSESYNNSQPYENYEKAAAEYKKILSNTKPALEMPKDPTGGQLKALDLSNLTGITSIYTVPKIVYVLNKTLNKISYEEFKKIYENVNSGSDTNLAHIKQLPYYILALKFQAANNGKPLIIQSKDVVQSHIAIIKQKLGEKYKNLKLELKKKEEDELEKRTALVIKHSGDKLNKSSKIGEILNNIINDLKTSKFPSSLLKPSKHDYAARAIRKAYKIDNVPGLKNLLEYIKRYKYEEPIEDAEKLAQEKCNPKKYGYSAYGINLIMTTLFNFDLCRKKYLSSAKFDNKKVIDAYKSINALPDTIKNLKQKSRKTPTITYNEYIKKIPELIKKMEQKLEEKQGPKSESEKYNVYDLIEKI